MESRYAIGRLGRYVLRCILFALTAAGLAEFGTLLDAKAQSQAVTILTGGDAAYTPIFVASDKGYFKNEGLESLTE
jgi:ABC-type nitrate/sulfonate/bicarbonate transport system substrate-binding protein